MGEFTYLEYEKLGSRARITLDNMDVANALSSPLVEELHDAMQQADDDDGVAAVELTGKDGMFCAGNDLTEVDLNGVRTARTNFNTTSKWGVFNLVESFPKPVIAAVNGTAMGGGFELALVSDLVVVGSDVSLGFPEPEVGLAPGIAWMRLPDMINHHQAMELMLTGKIITGAEAVDLGLFNRAVPVEAIEDEVETLVDRLANTAPMAATLTKKVANRKRGGEDIVVSNLGIGVLAETDDATEGVAAFKEKREPEFTGQ